MFVLFSFPFLLSSIFFSHYTYTVERRRRLNSIRPHSTRSPAIYYGLIAAKKLYKVSQKRGGLWIISDQQSMQMASHPLPNNKKGTKNPFLLKNYLQFEGNLSHFFELIKEAEPPKSPDKLARKRQWGNWFIVSEGKKIFWGETPVVK